MGEVYKAEDTRLNRFVAIKFLPDHLSEDGEAKRRFIQEAKAASALDHPAICTIHEIDETEDGRLFICMAFYEGETLKRRIERGPLPVVEAAGIALQVAGGLAASHGKGIVHRDIKPANILLTDEGSVRILDFGLAKLAGKAGVTRTFTTAGTAAYMSPEQVGSRSVDRRTDIWSLGVMLYEMLTGRAAFEGDYEQAVMYSICNKEPRRPAAINGNVSAELDRIVGICMKKAADERYGSVVELESDLRRFIKSAGEELTKAPGRTRQVLRSRKPVLRGYLFPSAILLLILVIIFLNPQWRKAVRGWFGPGGMQGPSTAAVLPFKFVGGEDTDRAFCDGLAGYLTGKLSGLEQFNPSFKLVSAGEVCKRGTVNPGDAWRSFRAGLAATGSMKRYGDNIYLQLTVQNTEGGSRSGRTTAPLIKEFSDPISNLSTWQDNVVLELAGMLGLDLPPQATDVLTAGGTTVPQAYEHYVRGQGYMHPYSGGGDTDLAIESFMKAVEHDSSYALAYAALGEGLWEKYGAGDGERLEEAIGFCERAIELCDGIARAHTSLGIIQDGAGRHEEAALNFERALEINPCEIEACKRMARMYESIGEIDRAEAAYRRSVDLRPLDISPYNRLGAFYLRHGRYEEAVDQFEEVVDIEPDNIRGYNNLGVTFFSLERWDEARSNFERSLQVEPNYSAYSNLGTLHYYGARYADAAAMYREALNMNDTDYTVWGMLAESYYWTPGKRDLAIENYRRAAELAEEALRGDPEDVFVLSDLAAYYAKLGNGPMSLAMLERAISRKPSYPEVMFLIGDTYEQLGEREEALEWIGAAIDRGLPLSTIDRYPGVKELRADDRFKRMLENRDPDS